MKQRLKKFWLWVKKEILNKQMLLWFIIAEIIFWTPCVVGALLGLTVNGWYWTICTVYIGFWAAPFTPAIPLQIGLAYGLKKLADLFKKRKKKQGEQLMCDNCKYCKEKKGRFCYCTKKSNRVNINRIKNCKQFVEVNTDDKTVLKAQLRDFMIDNELTLTGLVALAQEILAESVVELDEENRRKIKNDKY